MQEVLCIMIVEDDRSLSGEICDFWSGGGIVR